MPAREHRHTKIIFTIGPATESEEKIEALLRIGVDMCRLNMAHADHDWTRRIVRRVRKVCEKVGRDVAIMMDVKGPEVRSGPVDSPLQLEKGEILRFTTNPDKVRPGAEPGKRVIGVNYEGLVEDVKEGATLLVDSGLIRMKILEKNTDTITCEVIVPGEMGSRRHINLPGQHIRLPALTQKDKDDIDVGVEEGVDFYALSFVRKAEDLHILREYLDRHKSPGKIIAKIEDQSAIANLDAIIEACDGLMVARGDLGIEIPFENLPVVQRRAVNQCLGRGRLVIVATHMLESMIEQPLPTRAEITDLANAVQERADCVMLSGETTVGKYPEECVRVMDRVLRRCEHEISASHNIALRLRQPKEMLLRAAVQLAQELDHAPIIVFTRSGHLVEVLSALRPKGCPIFAFASNELVYRRMIPHWGVEAFRLSLESQLDDTVHNAFAILKDRGWIESGQWVVCITNALSRDKLVDTLQVRPA